MTADLENVFTTLFTAPAEAVVQAEADYRQIWAKWLGNVMELLKQRDESKHAEILRTHLNLAPVMKLNAKVEVGITLRVGSIKKRDGSVGVGLGVGAFQLNGSYGFMSQSSSESVMQARAAYEMTNQAEVTLKEFADTWSLPLTSATEVGTAITFLKTPTPSPTP